MPMVVRARSIPLHWLVMGALFGAGISWFAVRKREDFDLDTLTEMLQSWPGAEELYVRSFGQGICELVGSASGELDIAALVQSLASEPGVSAVVNRVWTVESGGVA